LLRLDYARQAERFLDACQQALRRRLLNRTELLPTDPVPHDATRVQSEPGLTFRLRVGDYRVLYRLEYEHQRILIVTIDKRSRAYE
jgi:mRNA interferase RelE/StbE